MVRTYLFQKNSYRDLKSRSTVVIDGERDVLLKSLANVQLALVLEPNFVAELRVDPDFDHNAYLVDLRQAFGFFSEPVVEFVIKASDLNASPAQLLRTY